MSRTFALSKRMSPYLAEKAVNLIDAMLLSTEEMGWDSQQKLIVNGRVYHDIDIVRLIAYVMSPADSISIKPIGLKVFISALRKIGLGTDYVINQHMKRFLRKTNQLNDDDTESINNSEDEKGYETSDHDDNNVEDDDDEDGEAMDGYDDTNDDDDSCYRDEDGNTEDDDDDDNDGNINNDSEEDDEYYDSTQDEEPVSSNMLGEYDWKSISDSDNLSVGSLPHR